MKKIVLIQSICLFLAVALGLTLKMTAIEEIKDVHKLAGMLSGLAGIVTLFLSFKTKQSTTIKLMAVVIVLLTISAGVGGNLLSSGSNYQTYYLQMVLSGFLAFVISIVFLLKLRKATTTKN